MQPSPDEPKAIKPLLVALKRNQEAHEPQGAKMNNRYAKPGTKGAVLGAGGLAACRSAIL